MVKAYKIMKKSKVNCKPGSAAFFTFKLFFNNRVWHSSSDTAYLEKFKSIDLQNEVVRQFTKDSNSGE